MATKFVAVVRSVLTGTGLGGTAIPDPLLREVVAGVEQAVAPHIVIAVPKIVSNPVAVTSAMAVGALAMDTIGAGGGANSVDVLSWRIHPTLRGDALNNKYAHVGNAVAIDPAAGTGINPLLTLAGVLQVPDICFAIPKAIQALVTTQTYVAAALATGIVTIQQAEIGAVNHDLVMFQAHTIQRVTAALFGNGQKRTRIFTILDTADAGINSIYVDAADATRLYQVKRAKVSGDGSLSLLTEQIGGATTSAAGAAGNLNLVSGTGDAVNAFTNTKWEKYIDVQSNVAVANIAGGGLVFDPGLVENGVEVMPDIVIPVPKATPAVSFVPTLLNGAVGPVNVRHGAAGAINHDILSIRIHSAFR